MTGPAPIPILPDLERRATYSPVASAGPFDVGFDLYGDGTDYESWLRVFLDGLELLPRTQWTLSSPSGPISAERARPIRDAQITLAAPATGQLVIVGEMRPRRTTQLTEGRGVSGRDFNLLATRLMTAAREYYDRIWRLEDQVATQITDPIIAPNAVRVDVVQDFSAEQKAVARANIGIWSAASYSELTTLLGASKDQRVFITEYDPDYPGVGGGVFNVLATSGGPFYGVPDISDQGSGYTDGNHVINLVGGGGTGATVFALVEDGKVTNIAWRTAGNGYTSAPSFNWSDIAGSGTPGDISFSLADGGVYVRTSSGALLAREEYLESGVVRPEWYGAKGIQTGDDGPAWNAVFAFIRTNAIFGQSVHHKIECRGGARYNILTPINATKLRSRNVFVAGNGALFHIRVAGGVGIDFTNSQNVNWPNLVMYGDADLMPKYGLVVAVQGAESSAWNDFENVEISGFFSGACLYNRASEFFSANNASFSNSDASGRAIIIDPINAESWNSPFAPNRTLTATTMSEISFSFSRFVSRTTAEAVKITSPVVRARFIGCYAAAFGGAAFGLHHPPGTIDAYSECIFDVRGEPRGSLTPNPITDMIKFYTDPGNVALHGVKITDYGFDYQRALLRNEGAGAVNIRGADMSIGSATDGGGKFASGGHISLEGRIDLMNSSALQVDFSGLASLRGYLYTRAAEGSITYPANYGLFLHIGGDDPKYVTSAQNLKLPLRITIGNTQVREYTADPEGIVSAPPGSLLLRKENNDSNTTLFLKISGSGNTGWIPVPADIAAKIHGSADKSTPAGSDELALIDSEDSYTLKRLSWSGINAALRESLRAAHVQTVDTTNRDTTSTSYVASGIKAIITPVAGRVRCTFNGYFGASASGAIIDVTLHRDATDLTPAGVNGLGAARVNSDGWLEFLAIDFIDGPPLGGTVTYEMYWRVSTGTAYLGRRGVDTAFDLPTTLTLEEVR